MPDAGQSIAKCCAGCCDSVTDAFDESARKEAREIPPKGGADPVHAYLLQQGVPTEQIHFPARDDMHLRRDSLHHVWYVQLKDGWHRIMVNRVSNRSGVYRYYLDGELWFSVAAQWKGSSASGNYLHMNHHCSYFSDPAKGAGRLHAFHHAINDSGICYTLPAAGARLKIITDYAPLETCWCPIGWRPVGGEGLMLAINDVDPRDNQHVPKRPFCPPASVWISCTLLLPLLLIWALILAIPKFVNDCCGCCFYKCMEPRRIRYVCARNETGQWVRLTDEEFLSGVAQQHQVRLALAPSLSSASTDHVEIELTADAENDDESESLGHDQLQPPGDITEKTPLL